MSLKVVPGSSIYHCHSKLFYHNLNEVYNNVSDPSSGSIKVVTPLKQTAEFLDALHSLAKVSSLHEQHAFYSLKAMDEAMKLIEQYESVINNVDHIKHERNIGLKSLNGLKGSVSVAIVDSLHLLHQLHEIISRKFTLNGQ